MAVLERILKDGHKVRRQKYAETGIVYMLHNVHNDNVLFKCGSGLYVSVRRMDVFTRYWCKEMRDLLLEQIKKSFEWRGIRMAKIFKANDERNPVKFACSILQVLARKKEYEHYGIKHNISHNYGQGQIKRQTAAIPKDIPKEHGRGGKGLQRGEHRPHNVLRLAQKRGVCQRVQDAG